MQVCSSMLYADTIHPIHVARAFPLRASHVHSACMYACMYACMPIRSMNCYNTQFRHTPWVRRALNKSAAPVTIWPRTVAVPPSRSFVSHTYLTPHATPTPFPPRNNVLSHLLHICYMPGSSQLLSFYIFPIGHPSVTRQAQISQAHLLDTL